jgi:hypothetical protein
MEIEKKIVVPCIKSKDEGIRCKHSMVGERIHFFGIDCWCAKWRENHSKDGIIYGCDKNFGVTR